MYLLVEPKALTFCVVSGIREKEIPRNWRKTFWISETLSRITSLEVLIRLRKNFFHPNVIRVMWSRFQLVQARDFLKNKIIVKYSRRMLA